MNRFWRSRARLCALVAGLALATPALAEGVDRATGVLQRLPADTAFFTTSLRNREQVEIVAKSKAFATLLNLPAAKVAQQMLAAQLASPDRELAGVLNLLKQPENQELIAVVTDALSDEVFVYGGASWIDFTQLLLKASNAMQWSPLLAALNPENRGKNPQELQAQLILNSLAANTKFIRIPDLVIGFRVKDATGAEAQVKRLEALLRQVLAAAPPPIRDGFKRTKVGDSSVLNLTVNGALVPWDELHIKDYEEKDGQYDALLEKLKSLTLSVSVGVHQGYVVLAIGQSAQDLARIGGTGKGLAELAEFRPLRKAADKRLTSIGYVSKALKATVTPTAADYADTAATLKNALKAAQLSPELTGKLGKDIDGFAEAMGKNLPEPGAGVSFSFLTDTGSEDYSYDYGTNPNGPDGSKPLTLVNHVGGDPIFWAVGRSKVDAEAYRRFAKWVPGVFADVEEAALSKLNEDQKEHYGTVKGMVLPLIKRLHQITDAELLPAMADGQMGFVLDAKWTSDRWHALMPKTPGPMPMPEIGIVIGISDKEKFVQAMKDYRTLINDVITLIGQLSNGMAEIPKLPPAVVEEMDGITLAHYPIPAELGLDPRVVPTAGIGNDVAALSFSRAHTVRLMANTPLKNGSHLLADVATKPLAGASGFNWPALVDAATPWIEMGVAVAKLPPTPPGPEGDVLKQVKTVLQVMKVYRGSASITYIENGALVTHSESTLRDLK